MPLYEVPTGVIGTILDHLDDPVEVGIFLNIIRDDHRYENTYYSLLNREFTITTGLLHRQVGGMVLKEHAGILIREREELPRSLSTTILVSVIWTVINVAIVVFAMGFLVQLAKNTVWVVEVLVEGGMWIWKGHKGRILGSFLWVLWLEGLAVVSNRVYMKDENTDEQAVKERIDEYSNAVMGM